jgi:acyl-CoA synthetase (AMP-forming)/AMP-acid ligase II
MGLRDLTLYHFIEHNARMFGSEPAVLTSDRSITHGQFLDRVDQLASGLLKGGIAKGDRICILAQNSPQYLELYGACAKIGAVAYPINWRLTAEEVQHVVTLADPQMMAVGAVNLPQLEGLDLSGLRIRAIVGEGSADGFMPFTDLFETPSGEIVELGSDEPFVIISTAAVAGMPRGAVLTHANLITAGYQIVPALELTSKDRHLAALPLFHITGLGLSLAMIQVGGANVVLETFDPAMGSNLIDEHDVTLMADFPPVLSMLLDAREATGAQWKSLRLVLGLDAPDVIQRLYAETDARFWTGFGQSETSGVVTLMPVDEKPGATGRPLPATRVRCVDELGEDVPVGEPGEIAVQGPLIFSGYWRDPDATDYAFRDGWHHTGDIGKFDDDGYLYYVGRKPEKDLIKSGGENVYPEEIERIIRELPQVVAVSVIGVPDPKWGEAVKAVVELAPEGSLTADEVIEAVSSRIASFKKPRHVDFVEELPRGPGGEIDREAVKAAHS